MQKAAIPAGSHKVCLQLPHAGRAIAPAQTLQKSQHPHQWKGNTWRHAAWSVPDLWELGGVLLIKARMRGFWPFQLGLEWCGVYHNTFGIGWSRSRQLRGLAGPPRSCTAPQLLHARRRSWLVRVSPCLLALVTWSCGDSDDGMWTFLEGLVRMWDEGSRIRWKNSEEMRWCSFSTSLMKKLLHYLTLAPCCYLPYPRKTEQSRPLFGRIAFIPEKIRASFFLHGQNRFSHN